MTPTREQVIEWAEEAGFMTGTVDYADGEGAFPVAQSRASGNCLHEIVRLCTLAHTAGRDQGLREAALICRVTPPEPFRPSIEAAHAIEQLRGK